MTDKLHKCRVSYPYDADLPLFSLANAMDIITKARAWLLDQDRMEHIVNVYNNGERGLLFVLSNRDTALMLKLALG